MSRTATDIYANIHRPESETSPADGASAHTAPRRKERVWRGIRKDLLRNCLCLALLLLGFIHDSLGSYTMYVWLLLIPFVIFSRLFRVSKVSITTLVLCVSYVIGTHYHKYLPMTFGNALVLITYPLTLYYIGFRLCDRCRSRYSIVLILLLCVLAYAIWPIVANIWDFVETGNIVNLSRSFDLDKKIVLATHQNMMMAMAIGGIGVVFFKPQNRFESRFKWAAAVVALFALFAAVHLLNRTALVLAAVSCVCAIFRGGGGMKRFIYLVLITAAVMAIGYYAIMQSEWGDLIEGFSSREQVSGYTANSAGGRTIRWMKAIQTIMTNPIGAEGIWVGFMRTFAHDVWLDIGLRGGWIPMGAMLLLTIWWIKSLVRFLKTPGLSGLLSGYVFIVLVTMMLQMAVEPVVEGQLPLFCMMFLNWAFLDRKYNLNKTINDQRPGKKKPGSSLLSQHGLDAVCVGSPGDNNARELPDRTSDEPDPLT